MIAYKQFSKSASSTMNSGLFLFALCQFLTSIYCHEHFFLKNTRPISMSDLESMNYGHQTNDSEAKVNTNIAQMNNPEELGSYFEGDIVFPLIVKRNGVVSHVKRWNNGVIPIQLRGSFSSRDLQILNTAFEMYHNRTCIKFIRYSNETDYVAITNRPTGCWSSVGRVGGQQILNLQSPLCMYVVGTTLHELMHVLGFYHEQSREDRDDHVEINWNNISSKSHINFMKVPPNTTHTYHVNYDYESILHYSPYAFAVDLQQPSITALNKNKAKRMGQREQLSKSDIEKIWKMYKCTRPTTFP